MAQRRMSRKSFRKSRGRKTRSMRKRTMGGEEKKTVQAKYSEITSEFNSKKKKMPLKRLDIFLTSSKSCPSIFFEGRNECEKVKLKYYSAVKYLLEQKPDATETDIRKTLLHVLNEKIEKHIKKIPDDEAHQLIIEGQKKAVKDFDLPSLPLSPAEEWEAKLTPDYLKAQNERADDVRKAVEILQNAKSEGGRKSRRKRKSRRR